MPLTNDTKMVGLLHRYMNRMGRIPSSKSTFAALGLETSSLQASGLDIQQQRRFHLVQKDVDGVCAAAHEDTFRSASQVLFDSLALDGDCHMRLQKQKARAERRAAKAQKAEALAGEGPMPTLLCWSDSGILGYAALKEQHVAVSDRSTTLDSIQSIAEEGFETSYLQPGTMSLLGEGVYFNL
eukprot:TRINITY_DN56177_c0_g1_i1.p1 TRINITY_DN56177_c0_g1~~TRINITY_DN56177_c0_g1_i1.p1  ORF type:complete len:198 (+),score=43.73 TRINITY_DN56177_c0_g1_i1:48-596(+)